MVSRNFPRCPNLLGSGHIVYRLYPKQLLYGYVYIQYCARLGVSSLWPHIYHASFGVCFMPSCWILVARFFAEQYNGIEAFISQWLYTCLNASKPRNPPTNGPGTFGHVLSCDVTLTEPPLYLLACQEDVLDCCLKKSWIPVCLSILQFGLAYPIN